jgi:hypothetical protein
MRCERIRASPVLGGCEELQSRAKHHGESSLLTLRLTCGTSCMERHPWVVYRRLRFGLLNYGGPTDRSGESACVGEVVPKAISSDPQHWLKRAAETRALADMIVDPEAKQAMLNIAMSYDHIATRLEQRERKNEAVSKLGSEPSATSDRSHF